MNNNSSIEKWVNTFCNEKNFHLYINSIDYNYKPNKLNYYQCHNTYSKKALLKDAKLLLYFSNHIIIH